MYEYKVVIDGRTYGMDSLVRCNLEQVMLDTFTVGNACSASLDVSLFLNGDEPESMAVVQPYVRETGTTDWYLLGTFYVDTREDTNGLTRLTCFDGMLKADTQFWTDPNTGEWPRKQSEIVELIAERIGLPLDSRNVFNDSYTVPYPNDDTMRTVLSNIAASHGGNWIVTADSNLLLVPLFRSLPAETSLLVTEDGDYITLGDITLGGVRLIV